MARRRPPTLAAIRNNPTLHPRAFAIVRERFLGLQWHLHAQSPDSSQAFALSAFLPVLEFPDRDALFEALVTSTFVTIAKRPDRSWNLAPEYADARILGETGAGEATRVDILLVAADAVVCVESKFRIDARQGWGKCSQPTLLCNGFHGAGSDRKGTSAWCRLQRPDGNRGPRYYWELARGHFREDVLAQQTPTEVCPFWRDYQLMRNYLFAAECARRAEKAYFGVLGMAPSARSKPLASGVERFQNSLLLPANAARIAFVSYESYVDILASGSAEARELAAFLRALLA